LEKIRMTKAKSKTDVAVAKKLSGFMRADIEPIEKDSAEVALAVDDARTRTIIFVAVKGETPGETVAKTMLGPSVRHGMAAALFAGNPLKGSAEALSIMDAAGVVGQIATDAVSGDLSFASRMLASQALTLDTMFTELTRRAAGQIGLNIDATDRYARLAMKAQSNCRTTLEALAKLHQPREQTVRHLHFGQGAQTVVADEFHNHVGGSENETAERAHEPRAQTIRRSTALPGPNAIGNAVPRSGDEG
jgi:hypothetical protein